VKLVVNWSKPGCACPKYRVHLPIDSEIVSHSDPNGVTPVSRDLRPCDKMLVPSHMPRHIAPLEGGVPGNLPASRG
jgi:hypothetical protein